MSQAKHGSTVLVHYTGMLSNGTVFDSTAGRDPVRFTIGNGEVIKGLEDAVIGMTPGESRTVTIPPERAHGPKLDERVIHLDKERLPLGSTSEVDQEFSVQSGGEEYSVRIFDGRIILDTNPKLAGKELTFNVELVEIL